MRFAALSVLSAALVAAGWGHQAESLPTNPVDRAATCAAVEAAKAREQIGGAGDKPLALETQGRILHYALLQASTGRTYESAVAAAVVKRMPAIADSVTGGDWQKLEAPCAAAYPAVAATRASLPGDRLAAALGCDELASFMLTALAPQSYAFGRTLDSYERLNRALDQRIAVLFVDRGIMALPARLAERNKALAAIVERGSPIATLSLCMQRYG